LAEYLLRFPESWSGLRLALESRARATRIMLARHYGVRVCRSKISPVGSEMAYNLRLLPLYFSPEYRREGVTRRDD